jgi:hypothetical protein
MARAPVGHHAFGAASLYIPEIYAIVRGEVGKPIEFGLNWGIERLRGGFLLATLAKDKLELMDSRFAVRAAKDHQALFGKAPRAYAYDRAGASEKNVEVLKELGVHHVGLAPVDGRSGRSAAESRTG